MSSNKFQQILDLDAKELSRTLHQMSLQISPLPIIGNSINNIHIMNIKPLWGWLIINGFKINGNTNCPLQFNINNNGHSTNGLVAISIASSDYPIQSQNTALYISPRILYAFYCKNIVNKKQLQHYSDSI
eukprot:33225_1